VVDQVALDLGGRGLGPTLREALVELQPARRGRAPDTYQDDLPAGALDRELIEEPHKPPVLVRAGAEVSVAGPEEQGDLTAPLLARQPQQLIEEVVGDLLSGDQPIDLVLDPLGGRADAPARAADPMVGRAAGQGGDDHEGTESCETGQTVSLHGDLHETSLRGPSPGLMNLG